MQNNPRSLRANSLYWRGVPCAWPLPCFSEGKQYNVFILKHRTMRLKEAFTSAEKSQSSHYRFSKVALCGSEARELFHCIHSFLAFG